MSNREVLAEIARLEGELLRIQRELVELRSRVGAPPRTKTRAFSAPPPPDRVPSEPPNSGDRLAPLGLSAPPPPAETTTRKNPPSDPAAGRYGIVGERPRRRG
jgi:hypothetical protein